MINKYRLSQIREVWINSYLRGETDWLIYLEAPLFFVTRNAEIITKQEQIAHITRNHEKLSKSSANDIEFGEEVTAMEEHKYWATVSGRAWLKRDGEFFNQCRFLELWIIANKRWQIASLCIEDRDHTEEI